VADGGKWWCQHCKRELGASHTGPCPYCGESGKEGEEIATVTIGVRVGAEAVHETHLSVLGWSILFLLIGLVAGAAIAIGLTVANQWYDYLATVAVTTILVVLIYRLKQSYRFIRWCQDQERTASGKRRFK